MSRSVGIRVRRSIGMGPMIDETISSDFRSALSGILGEQVASVQQIGGGKNSRTYRVECAASQDYLAKLYPSKEEGGGRDRLNVEFSSLQFLWETGVRCVPRPVVADRERSCAVYEYIDGEAIDGTQVTESDIEQTVRFLLRLKELSSQPGSERLPAAGEAWFSVDSAFASLQSRLNALETVQDDGPAHRDLRRFLEDEFRPRLGQIQNWCNKTLKSRGLSPGAELDPNERMLSPSDFGFHNMLRRPDGRIVFLDFEYFGWDDPAKLVSDFLTHPAVQLDEIWKRLFYAGVIAGLGAPPSLAGRVELLYPLVCLKWCLLLLNEFVPEHLRRRGFAAGGPLDVADLQYRQLAKAKESFRLISSEYERFPYKN